MEINEMPSDAPTMDSNIVPKHNDVLMQKSAAMENSHHTETITGPNSAFDAQTVLEVTAPAAAAVKAFNTTLNQTVQACQKECAGFWQLRMRENLELTTRLMGCRSLPEVQQAYAGYWQRAAQQYGREYTQMFHIMHDAHPQAPQDAPRANPLVGMSKH